MGQALFVIYCGKPHVGGGMNVYLRSSRDINDIPYLNPFLRSRPEAPPHWRWFAPRCWAHAGQSCSASIRFKVLPCKKWAKRASFTLAKMLPAGFWQMRQGTYNRTARPLAAHISPDAFIPSPIRTFIALLGLRRLHRYPRRYIWLQHSKYTELIPYQFCDANE
jgi:hypothetical protein